MSDKQEKRTIPRGAEREGDASIFGHGETPPPPELDGIDSTGGGIDGIGAATGPALGEIHPPRQDYGDSAKKHGDIHGHAVEGVSGSTPGDLGGGDAGFGAYNAGEGAPFPPAGRLEGGLETLHENRDEEEEEPDA